MRQSETIAKLAEALVAAQAEMGNAVKDSKNPFFKSKYADINSVREAVMPALLKHGISLFQPPTTCEGKNYIETVLLHKSGEFISSLNEVIVAKQNDPQSFLAAQTYTRRGALQAMLNVGTDDDDGNSANGRQSVQSEIKAAPKALEDVAPKVLASKNIGEVSGETKSQALIGGEPTKRSFRRNSAPTVTEEL